MNERSIEVHSTDVKWSRALHEVKGRRRPGAKAA